MSLFTKDRTKCIFCDIKLNIVFITKSHTSFSPSIYPDETIQILQDLPIGQCELCTSLQYMKIINPELLYKDSHNETSTTPTWKKHHNSFYEFCDKNIIDKKNILEIGGAQCILAKRFIDEYKDITYTVIDFIENEIKENRIIIKHKNCEEYKFYNESIIMSHVFEHLHNPSIFLENISKSNVDKIIISVPNLHYLLLQDNINLINIEHTFYFTPVHLFNLFGKYSFHCTSQNNFMNHSNFFCFERKESIYKQLSYNMNEQELLSTFFKRRTLRFDNIKFKETDINIWIVPAGHYGYILYQSLYSRNLYKNVAGFLDNDKSKQNKYMTSTSLYIYPFEILKDKVDITILLYGGPYTDEIKQQILSFNSSCSFIIF